MKTLKVFTGLALIASLSSFASLIGAEGFTMHLNNKLLVEHYFTSKSNTLVVSFEEATTKDQVVIYYNECGQIGIDRKLTLKDDAGQVLKEWSFTNSNVVGTPMTIQAKEILAFKKPNRSSVTLTYNSKRVAEGRLLTSITLSKEVQASSKR